MGKQLISEIKSGEEKGWQSVFPRPWQLDPLFIGSSLLLPTLLAAIGALCVELIVERKGSQRQGNDRLGLGEGGPYPRDRQRDRK